ncbi:hypothetical protein RJT34_17405 [Clitoria ternatea]|uniref:Uncharacterized protein n=1 Tax=Clitoria ternatea TaxID=43366 RepID=A0AAN9PDR9_CLITE
MPESFVCRASKAYKDDQRWSKVAGELMMVEKWWRDDEGRWDRDGGAIVEKKKKNNGERKNEVAAMTRDE